MAEVTPGSSGHDPDGQADHRLTVTQTSKPQAVAADRLWTVHHVSAFLGVPVSTLCQWRYLRVVRRPTGMGRHIRFDPVAVRTWLNTQDAYGR